MVLVLLRVLQRRIVLGNMHGLAISREYNGTANSDIQKNGIYVVFLTDDGGNVVDFTGVARIGFTDV